jgi:hypothetical protein
VRNPDWYVSANHDPFAEMLAVYDKILGDYLVMDDIDLIVATGLTQKPYDRLKYYWRLKEHESFLRLVGVKDYRAVFPRMTRDFLIEFNSPEAAARAEKTLSTLVCEADSLPIFGQIDNRGSSLFVTLTYPGAIDNTLMVKRGDFRIDLKPHVAFVAIKNGMHDANGFVYYKGKVAKYAPGDGRHIGELYDAVVNYFSLPSEILAIE